MTTSCQLDSQRAYLCSSYPEDSLYIVCENYTGTQLMDLNIAKGTLVGVVKQGDPMGNKDRWYIDTGGKSSRLVTKWQQRPVVHQHWR